MWGRWTSEYLRALRERHRLKHSDDRGSSLKVGDVVIVKSAARNRNCWPLGIIETLIVGRDQVVRGAKLRVGETVSERAVQHLYPLELSCDKTVPAPLDPSAPIFRPRRDDAAAANLRLQDVAHFEDEQ